MAEPKQGELYKGFYFKGGDPKDKNNWVKPPETGTEKNGFKYVGGAPFDPKSWQKIGEAQPKEAGIAGEDTARGFLSGLAKETSFGYAPQIAGNIEAAVGKAGELLGLSDPKPFEQRKQEVIQRFKDYETETMEKAPVASTIGRVAGFAAPMKATGLLMKGASKALPAISGMAQTAPKIAQIGKSAAEAGIIAGAQQTDGDMQERLHNAAMGALTGGAFTAGGQAIGAAGKQLSEAAKGMRIKGAGAMLKDFRNIFDRGQLDELDEFLKSKKLVGPGSSVASVAEKAARIQKETGKKLGDLYNQAKQKLSDPKFAEKLNSAQAFQKAGFAPKFQKDEILSAVTSDLKGEVGSRTGVQAVSNYLDDIVSQYGDDIGIVEARQIKSAIDRSINYSRNPLSPDPIKEQAFRSLRKYVNQRIDDQVNLLDEVLGGQGSKALKQLNKEYGNATTVLDMATDKFARENANRLMGFSEQVLGGATGLGYGIISGDPVSALGYGLLGAGGARLGKKFGPGFGAPLMQGAGGLMQSAGKGMLRTAPAAGGLLTAE